jgi:uncharacterized protein YbaP (TraB family)
MKAIKNLLKFATIVTLLLCNTQIQAQELTKTNLWKVEGKGIKTSYVFGTIHILPQEQFVIKDKVKKAFEATERVALEIDMADSGFASEVMKHAYLNKGEELKSYMSDEEFKLLDDHLKLKNGKGLMAYNNAKPLMLMSAIMTSSVEGEMASYEMSLMTMAMQAQKEIDGLELFASQVAIFDGKPYEEQIDDIVEMIEKPEESKEIFATMIRLYLSEDLTEMYNYTDEFLKVDAAMKHKLLDDRNEKWIPKIKEFSKSYAMFYAVGAGHLAGENGVINLLKREGFTVTPVLD